MTRPLTNTFDDAGQLQTTALKHGSTALDSYGYNYDGNGNRTTVGRVNGAYVNYSYDNIGQLVGALGYDPGDTLRHNENFGYGYDPAGNLLARTNDVLTQTFLTDGANQLTNILRNNVMTVAGALSNSVTSLSINSQNADLYNDLTFAASGVTLKDGMNVLTGIVETAGVFFTNSMNKVLPASVYLTNDANGNLTYDGQKGYGYDDANELTSITVTNNWRNEYVYDGFGRRRITRNYLWINNAWLKANEKRYVYDGNLVIQERDGANSPNVNYTRGIDLSGDFEGAGGIGGLLARTDIHGSAFYHADGNGNITMLIDSSGNQKAKYLYDSFGNTIGMWGALASINTYRFSSKEIDLQSGDYYYGARYYEPNYQRWANRDPIGELGGINLYRFTENDSINLRDSFGFYISITLDDGTKVKPADHAGNVLNALNQAESNGQKITDLTIAGHGEPDSMHFGPNTDGILVNGGNLILYGDGIDQGGQDITALLGGLLAHNAKINLFGCHTAQGDNNISHSLADLYPNTQINGENGWRLGLAGGLTIRYPDRSEPGFNLDAGFSIPLGPLQQNSLGLSLGGLKSYNPPVISATVPSTPYNTVNTPVIHFPRP